VRGAGLRGGARPIAYLRYSVLRRLAVTFVILSSLQDAGGPSATPRTTSDSWWF